jgi:hypothetical protein
LIKSGPSWIIYQLRCFFYPKTHILPMPITEVLDVTGFKKKYDLPSGILGIAKVEEPPIDINSPGLILHGSEADPITILKYGLAPQRTQRNDMENEWQICLGLNSKNKILTLKSGLSRKNSAVKYSGDFSPKGMVYVISDNVKKLPGYSEFWDIGAEARGYAWVKQAIIADLIEAVITKNIPKAAAAILATNPQKLIYKPDGTCYKVQNITD